MKRVLVHGYFRANLGDDLFFRVLALRYPDVMFHIPTTRWDYRELFRDLPNVKIIDFWKIAKLTSRKTYMLPKIYSRLHMRRFDAVVCIGGSLFIDRKNPTANDRIEAENYSFICDWEYAAEAGVPYFVLGANWGPCYNRYFHDYFSRAFDSLADLCFRDQASYREFAHKPAARRCGDILMDHPLIRGEITSNKKKQIAVSVISPEGKNEAACDFDAYYEAIAALCREYTGLGYAVKLLSFCRDEGDEAACDRVMSRLEDQSGIETVFYRGDWQSILRVMAESERIIASRFHATVLGWTLGVPVYSLVYSGKSLNLLEDCGVSGGYTRIENIGKPDAARVTAEAMLPENIHRFSGAEEAFARLDNLLR